MNETTQQALEQFVQKMLTAAEQGGSWTAEQAPLVVQEWLRWQMVSAAGAAAILLALCGVAAGLSRYCVVLARRDPREAEVNWSIAAMTAVIAVIIGLFSLIPIWRGIKVYIAPRVVVLEKFADLIK